MGFLMSSSQAFPKLHIREKTLISSDKSLVGTKGEFSRQFTGMIRSFEDREPSYRGVCAPYLQMRGFKNVDDVILITIFSADHVGLYLINSF